MGKWFFVYTFGQWVDEGYHGDVGVKEIQLKAENEADALSEAKAIWEIVKTEENADYEEEKKTWVNPLPSPFRGQYPNPRVIYKILLE